MASKDSRLQALIKAVQNQPLPVITFDTIEKYTLAKIGQNTDLLKRLSTINPSMYVLTKFLNLFAVLYRSVISIDGVRINKYGKFELHCMEMLTSLKALKSQMTPEVIDQICWVPFPTANDEHKMFLSEHLASKPSSGNASSKCIFCVSVYDFVYGKALQQGDLNPVFGKFQILYLKLTPEANQTEIVKSDVKAPPKKKSKKTSLGKSTVNAVDGVQERKESDFNADVGEDHLSVVERPIE